MLKWTTYGLIFLINLFLGSFFEGEVGVKIDTPTEVVAGNEFQVKVTIDKGKIESFSRFLQELPAGLKATSVNSSNADFTFRENKVRVIWLKMPETESVTITYTIKVDPRLKGTFDLTGKFSYIENNERISIEADPVTVNISPNPDIDPSLIVDIHDFKEKVIPEITPTGEMPVACFRQKPYASGDEDNSYIVNLLVYKENAQKFAKIEEFLPAGFKAIKIDSKEGIFVFKNNSAKFLWMNLPSSQYFVVSYRLIPLGSVSEPPVLKGQFSYVVDEKTYVKDIIEKDVDLAALSNDDIKRLIDELKASSVVVPKEELVAEKVSQPTEVTEELPKEAKTKPKPVVKPKSEK